MAEEQPSFLIDTDWKKQAQEEKKRLAEQATKSASPPVEAAPASSSGASSPAQAAPASASARRRGVRGEVPVASFTTLVQSIMTQVLYFLGEMAASGGQPVLDLDRAKYQLDTLNLLEDKTKGNLSADEQHLLDSVLYETRMRFVRVSTEMLGP